MSWNSAQKESSLPQPNETKSVLKKAFLEIKRLRQERDSRSEPIAIVGIGCRLPGKINSPAAFWQALCDGFDGITEVPSSRWSLDEFFDANPDAPGKMYSKWGGFLEHVDQFDARYFGITPREAKHIDPQHRLIMEVCWEALEHAGIPENRLLNTAAGVYIGISTNDYMQLLLQNQTVDEGAGYILTGVAQNLAAGRIAHRLGVNGPTLALDTACSSSLLSEVGPWSPTA